jgi:methylglutaconyl-CoA hydratase
LVGIAKAKELIFTARILNGEQCEEIGLVNYVVDENQAYKKALEIASEILPQGPIALKMAKNAINRGMEVG